MIRKLKDEDLVLCRYIIARCFSECVEMSREACDYVKKRFTAEGYLEEKAREYPFFVYDEEGVLAMGALDKDEIKKLYVDPDMHGKGVGSAMLQHLEKLARETDQHELMLYSYRNSQQFYERRGYKLIVPHVFQEEGIKMPTLLMRKKI
jgi:GNAT superfamily N-acetyltransferase